MDTTTNKKEPELIKAGDTRVLLGYNSQPPLVDIRVVAEDRYQEMVKEIASLKHCLEKIYLCVKPDETIVESNRDLLNFVKFELVKYGYDLQPST